MQEQLKFKKNTSVAIIMNDMAEVQKISNVFKKIGVRPFFFTSLSEFWAESFDQMPKLIVADVLMLNEGKLLFKSHPLVKEQKSEVIFYYNKTSEPLLRSTHEMASIGVLKQSTSYEKVLKSILDRLNRLETFKQSSMAAEQIQERYGKKVESLSYQLQEQRNIQNLRSLENQFCDELTNEIESWGFFGGINQFFQSQSWVEKFCLMELSAGEHKLISHKFDSAKSLDLPSVWLPQTCDSAMDFTAIEMGAKVFSEEIFGQFINIKISGIRAGAELVLFLNLNDPDILYQSNWKQLEQTLSAAYCKNLLSERNDISLSANSQLSAWEMLEKLDAAFEKEIGQEKFDQAEHSELIDISFERLFDAISEHPEIHFMWEKFNHAFASSLIKNLGTSTKYSFMSPKHIGLFVKSKTKIDTFSLVKALSGSFSYWKFFADSDLILAKDLRPTVRSVPVSASSYINYLDGKDFYSTLNREHIEMNKPRLNLGPSISL